jgi:hypothetical protein
MVTLVGAQFIAPPEVWDLLSVSVNPGRIQDSCSQRLESPSHLSSNR